MKNQYRIDTIRNIAIFIDKPVPVIDPKLHCYADPEHAADWQCLPAYDQKEVIAKGKGTRVYVDGKLAGFVKRKMVDPEGTEGDDHSLAKYLAALGTDMKSVRAIELMGGEELYARVTSEDLKKDVTDLTFGIPRHSHGRIVVALPHNIMAAGTTVDRKVPITVVQIYRKASPSSRAVLPVTDEAVALLSQTGNKQDGALAGSPGVGDGDEI